MKLKYYLRGLGTGILVTAVVLGIALSHGKGTMSDEEVKKRAAELGMVEEFKSLAEASKENEETEADKTEADKTEENEQAAKDGDEEEEAVSSNDLASKEQVQSKQEEASKENQEDNGFGSGIKNQDGDEPTEESQTKQPEESQNEEDGKVIILEVHGGDGSLTVARRAEAAGLVSSAAEFDKFLCNGGYDKKICTGKHEIPAGATMEEIAKLLIRKP